MTEPLRLFILAGEPSGDRIAADLVARLRHQVPLELAGVGGDELAGQGLVSLFPMSDLAVMGVTDVILNLPKLLWRIEQAARHILASRPDIVVLVDAQDFSKLLARRLRAKGYQGPLVLYVAPSVWARNPERAAKLTPLFNEVLAVLPFEPEAMARLGGPPTHYVGHPALAERLKKNHVPDSGPLLLLPGSRDGELRRHMPLFRAMAEKLSALPQVTGLVIPTLPSLRDRLIAETAQWPVKVTIAEQRADRATLYGDAVGALCVSGTATLELALAGVPMVVVYAMDAHQSRVFERLGKPAVSLPNIILGRPVLPELVAAPLEPPSVEAAAMGLLTSKKARQDQLEAFGELVQMMEAGQASYGRQDPADRVLALWRNQRELIGS